MAIGIRASVTTTNLPTMAILRQRHIQPINIAGELAGVAIF